MFDSHCHITDIINTEAPELVLAKAQAAGVRNVLTCGYDTQSNQLVCDLAKRMPHLPFALGLHPWYANENVDDVLRLIEAHHPTAIGEIGLDLWGDTPCWPIDRQLYVLEAQLQCAVRLDLPVTLHSRKAVDTLLHVLRNHPGIRGALHAYSGSYEQIRPLLDVGLYVGVGGAITRNRAKRVRRCASLLPLDRILLETDAPAIGMDAVSPPHVRPEHLVYVRDALAAVRSITPDIVDQSTDQNASALFGVNLQ